MTLLRYPIADNAQRLAMFYRNIYTVYSLNNTFLC